ncbi:MAG TPA: oxygenase MpaB family protein [Acidimicrobiales bacterium]|nr:oxygenase MpaB family protein [Acidimicrobiales bacterium]
MGAAGFVRATVGGALRESFSAPPSVLRALADSGDGAGLFGPESVTWKVHAHPAALVGGIRSLIVQTLHPLVMTGVAQHSDYRSDPLGRLRRTAAFVATTTYGSARQAEEAVAGVRRLHEHVRGAAPDGRRYYGNDPELLAWVHHVEVESFLLAYRRVGPGLSDADADRYVEEMACVGELIGASPLFRKVGPLHEWVIHHPEVRATHEAREAVRFLSRLPVPLAAWPAYLVCLGAAISLVPWWWRLQLGLVAPGPVAGRLVSEPMARALIGAMGWVLGPSPALSNARGRVGTTATTP